MKRVLKYVLLVVGSLLIVFAANFFIIKKLNQKALESIDNPPSATTTEKPYLVPSKFVDSSQFFVKIPLRNKDTLLAFCDTGGGISMLSPYKKKNPAIDPYIRMGVVKGIMPMDYAFFNEIVADEEFPVPNPVPNLILRNPFAMVTDPYFIIPRLSEDLQEKLDKVPEMDAFLGQGFFMGKSWTLDYPNQEVWVNTPLPLVDARKDQSNIQKLHFKKNDFGTSVYGHPRMQIEIDSTVLDVLFDTGASFVLSDDGKNYFNTSKNTMAGSFISATIFDGWRKKHPDWKYYPASDGEQGIIAVPKVRIGPYEVGPVLFSRRPDYVWSEIMIHTMDKVVQGAIGGTLLKHFKVTIDYNSELVKFEK